MAAVKTPEFFGVWMVVAVMAVVLAVHAAAVAF